MLTETLAMYTEMMLYKKCTEKQNEGKAENASANL